MISKILGFGLLCTVLLNISFAAPLEDVYDVESAKRAFHMGLGKRSESLVDVIPVEEVYLDEEDDSQNRKPDLNQFHMGFGKRDMDKRLSQFHMGLGKRAAMYMGLGKRAFHMGLGKRQFETPESYSKKSFHMGLGKR